MADMRLFKPDTARCFDIWSTRDGDEKRTANFVGTSLGPLLIWSDGSVELQGGSVYLGDGYRLFTDEGCENAHNWPSDWPPRSQVEEALIREQVGDVDLLGIILRSEELVGKLKSDL